MLSARFTQFDQKRKLVDVSMFSLISCFGLISFVVSAHSNNDTLHGGYKLNISTTMSTLPSTRIPVAKDCVLEMKESEISEIVELFNNDRVHVVDIHVSFAKTSHDKEISDFRVKLLNPIGREILYSLESEYFKYVTWTLNVGIRSFKLHVSESQKDCIKRQKNVINFAFENMQNIVRSVNLATNYEVWYYFKETSSEKVHQICCQITKHNSPKCNHGCSTGNLFLYANSGSPWIVIIFLMSFFFALFYFMWLLHLVLSRTEFDLEYPKYYKLKESRMSPSFILFKIIFEENSCVVSFIRSCVPIGVHSYCTYLLFRGNGIMRVVLILPVLWGLYFFIQISYLYKSKVTRSSIILTKIKEERKKCSSFALFWFSLSFIPDVNEFRQEIESGEFAGVIKVLTLPFNIKYWRKIIKKLNNISAAFIERVSIKFRNRIFKILAICICYVLAVLLGALSISIVFLYLIFVAILFPSMYMLRMMYLILVLKRKLLDSCYPSFRNVLAAIHCFFLFAFLVIFDFVMAFAIQSFLVGLFLNLIYFVPYFAFFSVLTFYCCNYWKTMEEKYLVLKRLIYEACRDIQHVNNGCIPSRNPKREEKVLPVVSKELDDKIREKLLPYDTNLFYFAFKIFWAFVFSFGILKLIEMLDEFNVTGVVQVITTASLGVMPHIFNMIALKTSEEKKKAREEKLKLNVKYMVEDLLRADPKLVARTVLIIQQNNDATTEHPSDNDDDLEDPGQMLRLDCLRRVCGTTSVENVQGSENVQVSESDMNATDNDDAEGSESTAVLMPRENNDTTADENVHDSEKTESLLKLLARAIFNNDATTEENVQDSEHPCVDDAEDPELTRLLEEVYGKTTDENVQNSEHPYDNDDAEDPELTRLLEEVYGKTTDKNVHDSEHPSDNDDFFYPELTRRLISLLEVHVHNFEHTEARSGLNPPDNDNVEDPELGGTLIIEGINDATADEIDQHSEHVQGSSDLNPPDRDDVEELPIAIADAQKSRDTTADENFQDYEHTEARSDLNSPDNDDIEEFSIVIVHTQESNDTTAEENVQDSERAQAGSGLNRQNLRDNREENVQDYELFEVKCDNDDENARVKENIQY